MLPPPVDPPLSAAPKTSLVASHDLEFILETCRRVIILDDKKIKADGTPPQIIVDSSLMERHALDVPHTLR